MGILTRFPRSAALAAALWLASDADSTAGAADFMMQTSIQGEIIEGRPLAWTSSQMFLLGRDGRLHEFDPRAALESRKTAASFVAYTMPEMKQALYREFGTTSEITTTQHYIVVHPAGQRSDWADRFEQLYRSFHQYFRVRGFQPKEPPYPLVAVVFRNEAEYVAYAARNGITVQQGMLGHYSNDSNRVYLFDIRAEGGDWTTNAETIIHEATHQTAFNTGIHNRFASAPRWLVEGLAMMYEARGVYDTRGTDTRQDRINASRLHDFHNVAATHREPGFMEQLIATDTAFRSNPIGAYADAWALTFFLAETRPRMYAEYLSRTASREKFTEYQPAERLRDFQEVFGDDLRWLESQFLGFMEDIQ